MFCSIWDELFHPTVASCAEEARTHSTALRVDNIALKMGTNNLWTMAHSIVVMKNSVHASQALSIIPSTWVTGSLADTVHDTHI